MLEGLINNNDGDGSSVKKQNLAGNSHVSLKNFSKQMQSNNNTNNRFEYVVGDTEVNVTEFDEEDKRTKVDNFIKLLYYNIPTASQQVLEKKTNKS